MLVNLEPVRLREITPSQLLEWTPEVWLELRKVIPVSYESVFSKDGYYFSMVITDTGLPSVRVQNPLMHIKYLHFTEHPDILVAQVLTGLACHKGLNPQVLLEGIKATFDGFLKLHASLCQFQTEANNLAKEYICEK